MNINKTIGSRRLYPQGYVMDIEAFEKKFKVGDIVKVPAAIAGLTHEKYIPQIAEVVGLYPHFFNVKYEEGGWVQSIQYRDAGLVVDMI